MAALDDYFAAVAAIRTEGTDAGGWVRVTRTLPHLADRIRAHRRQQRARWRRLAPHDQALLTLAHLRNGDTYTRLAAGYGIGITTAWRYVQEAIALLAAACSSIISGCRLRLRPAATFADRRGEQRMVEGNAGRTRAAG